MGNKHSGSFTRTKNKSESQPITPPSSPTSSTYSESNSNQHAEKLISNWKLFNDLENREEAEILELSSFLEALAKYMPGLEDKSKNLRKGISEDYDAAPQPLAFSKTISETTVGSINITNMYATTDAQLPEIITLKTVTNLIEACKKGVKIHRSVVVRVIHEAMALFQQLRALEPITVAPAPYVTIIGDLHGQLDDLLLIFKENGLPSPENPYLFNGDIVDRGDRGVEITIIIYLFKLLYPDHVYINRGNHEEHSITQVFGFMKECETKYDTGIFHLFCESFKWLPLAHLINKKVLVVHGGPPRDAAGLPLKEFLDLPREKYDLSSYLNKPSAMASRKEREMYYRYRRMRDILWSDPQPGKGWEDSSRGAGIMYGPDLVQKFMTLNRLSLIVRSHECVPRGFDWPYGERGMLVTLFSASNYCGRANNFGCFMRIPADLKKNKPSFFQYMATTVARDLGVSNLDALCSLVVSHSEELLAEFEAADEHNTKKVSLVSWCRIMEEILNLSLDWKALRPLLTEVDSSDGCIPYMDFLERYNAEGALTIGEHTKPIRASPYGQVSNVQYYDTPKSPENRMRSRQAFNALYRHRARLEALFRMLDFDGNGTISVDELERGIQLLNQHLPEGSKAFTIKAMDLMKMLDFTKSNQICINEFMEGFRLNARHTRQVKWNRARKKLRALSAFGALRPLMQTPTDQTAVEVTDYEAGDSNSNDEIVRSSDLPNAETIKSYGSVKRMGILQDLKDSDLGIPSEEEEQMEEELDIEGIQLEEKEELETNESLV